MSERFSVVRFEGYPIHMDAHGTHGARLKTDWHVVDERGRTVHVFTNVKPGRNRTMFANMRRAERYAAELNAKAAGERIAT